MVGLRRAVAVAPPARPTRKRPRVPRISYKESSEEPSDDSDDELTFGEPARKTSRRSKVAAAPAPKAAPRPKVSVKPSKQQRRGRRPPVKGKLPDVAISEPAAQKPTRSAIISDNIIPAWHTLPYEILVQIFTFASYPLRDENFHATPSVNWLLNAAHTCRNFAEPALTAFYRCPPLLTLIKPHHLVQLLNLPPDKRLYNYNAKVKRLELDVRLTLVYTAPGKGLFDLNALLLKVPQLTELEIYHHLDRPPYREIGHEVRWCYPEILPEALQGAGIRLKSWIWNGKLDKPRRRFSWWCQMYESAPFQSLQRLTVLNFPTPQSRSHGAERTCEEWVASALNKLPQLKEVVFQSCCIVNDKLFRLLPENLTHVSLINCPALNSDSLHTFLASRGRQLKQIVLNHNQSLDIAFLPHLKSSCPELEVLRMDLNYYNSHSTHHDSDPKYESLLEETEVPRWPTKLRVLEMVHLRKWTSEAAKTLFTSLIDSAEELTDLRTLVLKVILNISWRDRAGFRDEWIGRLQRVFLRVSAPPSLHLQSLRAFREWKQANGGFHKGISLMPATALPMSPKVVIVKAPRRDHTNEFIKDDDTDSDVPLIQRSRSAVNDNDTDSDDVPLLQMRQRRSKRIAAQEASTAESNSQNSTMNPTRARIIYKEETSSSATDNNSDNTRPSKESVSGDAESSPRPRRLKEEFIQGMCEIVDVRIDNLRPTENQFSEGDFLDTEVSGDEEWDGRDEEWDGRDEDFE